MKVSFHTLGCKVNLYETEVMINLFKNKNYEIVDFNELSDICIINTCTVTNTSDKKSRNIIRQAIKNNPNAVIVVVGCYSQIKPLEVEKIDGVNIILGTTNKSKIVEIIEQYLIDKKNINLVEDLKDKEFECMELDTFETKTRAFVKIQDGCNNFCSYCIIPYARGNIKSKAKEDVIKEVNNLVNNGYKEVVLTGIHTGHYGKDRYDYDFSDLLEKISEIKNLNRIRISSIEVTELDDKFLNQLKNNKKIVDHLHIPLQSGCNKTLIEMNRKYDTKYFLNKINEIRKIRPNISITTDVIVGFPNESDEDFNMTYEFIKNISFSKVHVFPYSRREGTKADKMENQISTDTKKYRAHQLLKLSKELEIKYINKFLNTNLEVLIEKYEDGIIIGHTSNYILVKSKGNIEDINKNILINITSFDYPYLYGNKI